MGNDVFYSQSELKKMYEFQHTQEGKTALIFAKKLAGRLSEVTKEKIHIDEVEVMFNGNTGEAQYYKK